MGAGGVEKAHENNSQRKEIPVGVIELSQNLKMLEKEKERIYSLLPKDQYLCPKCGDVPELLNIYSDNGYIEFDCKIDGKILLKVDEYFKNLYDSQLTYFNTKCSKCNKIQSDNKTKIFQFCYKCQQDYCFDCVNNKNKHSLNHLEECIPINEKKTRCPEHFKEGKFTKFCQDDKTNLCNILANKKHKGHNHTDFYKIQPCKEIIIEKNKMLADMIIFNEIILKTYEDFPDNYYHIKNVEYLAKSIEQENLRDKNELENLSQKLEAYQSDLKKKKENIQKFKNKFDVALTGIEQNLSLPNKGLMDSDIEILLNINFKRLLEINLSNNKIKTIEFLLNLNTALLDTIKLGDNEIKEIKTLELINLLNLTELDLKNNIIQDPSPLLNLKNECLELLRIDGNNEIDMTLSSFKQVLKKYTKSKLIYIAMTFDQFNEKYKCKISNNVKEINLSDKQCKNDVLKELYILSHNYDEVENLILRNCEIDDISYLSKISFSKLKILDLSLNNIKNIENIPKMKIDKLKQLFLDNNKITYISPLMILKANLEILTIKDNEFKMEDAKFIIDELKKKMKGINIDLN